MSKQLTFVNTTTAVLLSLSILQCFLKQRRWHHWFVNVVVTIEVMTLPPIE